MLQTALEFLRQHNELALATCDGPWPRLRQFQIMRQEGTTLFFTTSPRKEVYRQLLANPRVELLAMADQVSVRCSGLADFQVDEATSRWIFDHNPVLPRLYDDPRQLACFKVPLQRLDYYDLRPTPPQLLHFDLLTGTHRPGFVGEKFAPKE